MKKTISLIGTLTLVSVGLLTGCNNEKDTAQSTSELSQSHVSTESKQSTTMQTTESSSLASTSTSETSTTSQQSTDHSDATQTTASSVSNEFPYAVDLSQYGPSLTFYFHGVNVPDAVTIKNTSPLIISIGDSASYEAQVDTIATKEIRIFSANDNGIRTVKVNTQLTFAKGITSNGNPDFSHNLYLFTNKEGGLSLITPNYAGNVSDDQRDVMLEVLQ
ncbi:hypothetical protein Q1X24_01685 [Enterococcus sp. B1E4]|uniref:hypothetical protein n=1 Tax=unclassified Enterococcus TaxID=2608891 RepID=UPI00265BF1E0|nr:MULTISPECIES: hypothetical protein [unclassified Enterococcus]MDO0893564.1 hypothetical protein [Enterococcus sp. B1E4]MDO0906403.1 hypothetical protein [Enterococcus sp. B2E4]